MDKFIRFLSELEMNGTLRYYYDHFVELRVKMAIFKIPFDFNYDLWRRLHDCIVYFNYMKISKARELKLKWLEEIFVRLPDLHILYHETHEAFNKFKKVVETYIYE